MSHETLPAKADLLGRLAESLGQAAGRTVAGGAGRTAARELGQTIAASLDGYWKAAGSAAPGPVDVVDLFSGCGGMSAGFHALNGAFPAYRLALAIDVDETANQTYAHNLPLTPTHADIEQFAREPGEFSEMVRGARRSAEHPLVLIGCAPCQGFSSHRNANGADDPRNTLFGHFARLAVSVKPDAVIVENVPELLTDRNWAYVAAARDTLREAGYEVYIGAHNMAEFSVPQERFRAVLIAMRRRFEPPDGFLPRDGFKTVRNAIGLLPHIEAGERLRNDPMHYTARHRRSTLDVLRAVPKDGGNRPANVGPACLTRMARRQGKPGYEDVYGRLAWNRPAVTITNYARNPASGRFAHPDQDRGLSVREAALLQGFPSDYWFAGGLDPSFRQIGNAVPPSFAAFLAASLVGELVSDEPSRQRVGIEGPIGPSFSRLIPALKSGTRTLA